MTAPTPAQLNAFVARWSRLVMEENVAGMLDLLKPEWLNYWWHALALYAPPPPFYETCRGAVDVILFNLGLVGDRSGISKAKRPCFSRSTGRAVDDLRVVVLRNRLRESFKSRGKSR